MAQGMGANLGITAGIVILGGGPAGASAAIKAAQTLKEENADPSLVVLVEKRGPGPQTHTNEKVCGGFVMKDGLDFMSAELGLDPMRVPNNPIEQIYFADGGLLTRPNWQMPTAIVPEQRWGSTFHRKDIDTALIMRAQELGATVLFGHSAGSVTRGADGVLSVEVQGPRGANSFVISTRFLVGAFGANPNLRAHFFRIMGVELMPEDDLTGVAYRFIADGMPADFPRDAMRLMPMQVETGSGGMASTYAWDWPVPDESGDPRANLGFGYYRLKHKNGATASDIKHIIKKLFPSYVSHAGSSNDAGLFAMRGAHLPVYRPGAIPEIVIEGGTVVALIGDAAGHVNPLNGEGIADALHDGMLGVALAQALISQDLRIVKSYLLSHNLSPSSLYRRLATGIASELFHDPKHFRRLLDTVLIYPEAGKLLTAFVKRKLFGINQLDAPTLRALMHIATNDPSIVAAILRAFREAARYAARVI